MGKYIYKGAARYNQLNYPHNTPKNIIAVIDDGKTLTIYTKDADLEPIQSGQRRASEVDSNV